MMKKIIVVGLILLTLTLVGCNQSQAGEGKPEKIRLDYAHYSPTSLVLHEFGWAEELFEEEGIEVEWAFSQGSNKALEFLNSNSVDFGSTAGAAALISKTNGSPIETVYIYSKPEWTALVTNKDSDIQSVEDLKGKKVAATIGTDPYIFLLRALNASGLTASDIELVNLQHGDGAVSLSQNQVDAWAGLDPHMAKLELDQQAELFFREPDFNTYGFLNVRSDFLEKYPDYVGEVIGLYEKARTWIIENEAEAIELISEKAEISTEVAARQLERNDFSEPVPGDIHVEHIIEAGKVLQSGDVIDEEHDLESVVDELINPSIATEVIN
jgi:sulfonate transport system substrate-binding protein